MNTLIETIDWDAVEICAERCGARTRRLAAERDLDELAPWVLMLTRQSQLPAAATYFELAVLIGATQPPAPAAVPDPDEDVDWDEPEDEAG